MTARWPRRAPRLVCFGVLALVPAPSAFGAVAGVTLNRTPSPPQAVKIGSIEQVSYLVQYETKGISTQIRIVDPSGTALLTRVDPIGDTSLPAPGTLRNFGGANPLAWTVPNGVIEGRYKAEVQFTSNIGIESIAAASFDVAAQLGRIEVIAFEDLNGNGVRDVSEVGLKGWAFDLTNPSASPSGVETGTDGSSATDSVPAGRWNVKENVQTGWLATTASQGSVLVPPNGAGTFAVGQVRPGTISGTVFIDANRNGVFDTGEVIRAGASLTLTGQDGGGRSVTLQATSASDGSYRFGDLFPGTYTVSAGAISGLEFTSRQTISGLAIQSNGERPRVDFGLATATPTPPPVTTPPTATPTPPRLQEAASIVVKKLGPTTAKAGETITYRIAVKNTGSIVAKNVVVTDPIPNLMTLVAVPAKARVLNGIVTWELGNLAAGKQVTLTMRVRLAGGAPAGRYANTATATADNGPTTRSTTALRVPEAPTKKPPTGGVTG